MHPDDVLAYLAGMMDGDGYFKVTKSYRWGRSGNPYYGISIGVQQLWPGEAVRLFAVTFGGEAKPWILPSGRTIARCEIHTRKAGSAVRRLLPYLLVKKEQALLLLEVAPLMQRTANGSSERNDGLEAIRQAILSLHEVASRSALGSLPITQCARGYERLGPAELGWTRNQILAYLAGTMDSDGSFRVEKRRVRGMLGPHYRICIRCAQVIPSGAVELLANTFGGHLAMRQDKRPHSRNLVSWSLHDRTAVSAIVALLPFLVVKEAEALLLLELRRLKAQGKKGLTVWKHANRWRDSVKMRKRCYTAEQLVKFERIFQTLQTMHSHGWVGTGDHTSASSLGVFSDSG